MHKKCTKGKGKGDVVKINITFKVISRYVKVLRNNKTETGTETWYIMTSNMDTIKTTENK